MIPLVTNVRDEHTAMPMLGEAQISIHQHRLPMIWCVLVCILACSVGDESRTAADTSRDLGTSVDMDDGSNTNQQLISFSALPSYLYDSGSSILIQLEDPITGQRANTTFEPANAQDTFALNLNAFSLPLKMSAYLDLNQTGSVEPCGFPARSGQIITDDSIDLWSGTLNLEYQQDMVIDFPITRNTCGPGSKDTAWVGFADIAQVSAMTDATLYLELISNHSEEVTPFRTLISVPTQGRNEDDLVEIRLENLLPGQHQVRLFEDTDQNLEFSPCERNQISGGDRIFSLPIQFELSAAQEIQSGVMLIPTDSGCEQNTTTIMGMVDLEAMENKTVRQTSGRIILTVTEIESGTRLYSRELFRNSANLAPFNLTNLPSVPIEVHVFIDRDHDDLLTSCALDDRGQDLFSSRSISLFLEPNENRNLGVLRLEEHDCPTDRLSNFEALLEIEPPGSRKESPRPIYGVLTNQMTGEQIYQQIADDHTNLTNGRELSTALPPGEYSFYAFVDSEADGVFSHCEFDAFGDRAVSELLRFSLSDYELFNAQSLEIQRLGCDFPTVQFNLNVNVENLPPSLTQINLVIDLIERGGLSESVIFDIPPVSPPWAFTINNLVPGTYDLTVYLDRNMNQILDSCEMEVTSEHRADAIFTLDRSMPTIEASLNLQDQCAREGEMNEN